MRPSGDEPKSPNVEHIRASERRSPDGMQRSCPEGRLRARMPADFRHGLLAKPYAHASPTDRRVREIASAQARGRGLAMTDGIRPKRGNSSLAVLA